MCLILNLVPQLATPDHPTRLTSKTLTIWLENPSCPFYCIELSVFIRNSYHYIAAIKAELQILPPVPWIPLNTSCVLCHYTDTLQFIVGQGVFAEANFLKGDFLLDYSGEVIKSAEGKRRLVAQTRSQRHKKYPRYYIYFFKHQDKCLA